MYVKIFRRLNLLLHFLLFGVLFFVLTATSSAQTPTVCVSEDNLVVNGCFETPLVPESGSSFVNTLPGWSLSLFSSIGTLCPQVEFELHSDGNNSVSAFEGAQFGEFDSGCEGFGNTSAQVVSISQVIDTTPFHTYEVSFTFRRAPGVTVPDANLVFEWNNITLFDQPAPASWQQVTFEVIAEAESTELWFVDDDIFPDFSGTLIDAVSVVDLGASCVIDPTNLVVNGCFEAPHVTEPIFEFFTEDQIPGWSLEQFPATTTTCATTFFEIQYEQNALLAYEGAQFGEFESGCDSGLATQSASIFQTINTIPNHRYQVSFAGAASAANNQFIRVDWNGNVVFNQQMTTGWQEYVFDVIANSSSTVIRFSEPDETPDYVGSLIDDIRVVDLGPTYGDLLVQKDVNTLGTPVNMAVEFEICITGPSYPGGNCYRFDGDGGTYLWQDLIPGEYTVLETLPGNDWIVTQPVNPVIVPGGGQASAYVLNTLATGSIHATKSVNWNGVPVNEAQSFTLCINSELLGNVPNCQVVGANGGLAVWDGLVPGTYNVYEFDPGGEWSASGGGPVGVLAGQIAFATITNTHNPPVTATPPPPTCVHDLRVDLSGVLINGATGGQVTNNGTETCTYPIGLASYTMIDNNIDNQTIFDATVASVTIAPGQTVELGPIALPSCSAQVDLFYGDLITPQFNGSRYGSRLLMATIVNGGNYCPPQ